MTRKKPTEIKNNRHANKRRNIPTQEMSDFMTDDQRQPMPLRYPRNPALDPQLVWQGKDEQNSHDMEVLSMPIYIQEKIHPQVIIEHVKALALQENPEPQPNMFADFNNIEFEKYINFYEHEQNWSNRMILGDSLQVMASLADREGLKGQVQMIYLDPPYGIKFSSNWQVSTRNRSVKETKAGLSAQPEQIKAFRDTWELGIHSYLAYLRDRLMVARDLLTESGSVFMQIGDENVHLVRSLMDEVFGRENFVSEIVYVKTTGFASISLDNVTDIVIWYAKNKESLKYKNLYQLKNISQLSSYNYIELSNGIIRRLLRNEKEGKVALPLYSKVLAPSNLTSEGYSDIGSRPFIFRGKEFSITGNRHWKTNQNGLQNLSKANRLIASGNTVNYIRYNDDFSVQALNNVWTDIPMGMGFGQKYYIVQSHTLPIQRCMLMATDPGDLVLDPTCGSGTTAYVAEQWGRRWITCDTSRVALTLARTRLMAAKYPYYKLADPEGKDLRHGFTYKTVPHIMLKHIANNPEIDSIHAKWQKKLEPLRQKINRLLGETWEEWEVPRLDDLLKVQAKHHEAVQEKQHETETKLHAIWQNLSSKTMLPDEYKSAVAELTEMLNALKAETEKPVKHAISQNAIDAVKTWWQYRQKRQAEIDKSIANNSKQETLYDQPHEVRHTVRVTGPFTVESLSPFKPISPDSMLTESEETGQHANAGKFESRILENLRTAGLKGDEKQDRVTFDYLESYEGGSYIQGEGEYSQENGKVMRVAVAIGPEHGTVGKDFIKEAATEATRYMRPSADELLVCAFSFDAEVNEEVKQWGRLKIIPIRMNPDLAIEGLKKTDSANLFMVFGEPDISYQKKGEKIIVTLHGMDVYQPRTGEIRSSNTKDIACWFIDTNYDGKSFFVRQAYFTGVNKPYQKLQKALKSDINESAWQKLYRTESMPFVPPETGKFAVKVINHFGDEVMQVYSM